MCGSTAISGSLRRPDPWRRRESGVNTLQAIPHGVFGYPLQMEIECRVHVEPLGVGRQLGVALGQHFAHGIDSRGRRRAPARPPSWAHARLGLPHLAKCSRRPPWPAGLRAPIACALRRIERGECRWRLDHAGNRSRLGQREVSDILAKEEPRGFRDPMNGKRAPLTEIDLVQIQLENFIFGRTSLEDERHELLEELPSQRLLRRQKKLLTSCWVSVLAPDR